jgi:hypothetical protein
MDLEEEFNKVVRLANDAPDPGSAWQALVHLLTPHVSREMLTLLNGVVVEDDVTGIREQIRALLVSEPPPPSLQAFYFGLFDAVSQNGIESIGYYISGVDQYDADDPDCLCDPVWWPQDRYLKSTALDAIKRAELSANGEGRQVLAYAGQLGAALLVSRFASRGLLEGVRRLVGFDSGDGAEVLD